MRITKRTADSKTLQCSCRIVLDIVMSYGEAFRHSCGPGGKQHVGGILSLSARWRVGSAQCLFSNRKGRQPAASQVSADRFPAKDQFCAAASKSRIRLFTIAIVLDDGVSGSSPYGSDHRTQGIDRASEKNCDDVTAADAIGRQESSHAPGCLV